MFIARRDVVRREQKAPADPADTTPELAGPPAMSSSGRVPRTRTGTAWFSICVVAVALVVLIVFMLQNTRSVEVSFLWMRGSVPLALALLVAGVGVAILAMAVGGARVGQLRRLARRQPSRQPMSPTVSDAVQPSYTKRSPASPEASPSAGGKDST